MSTPPALPEGIAIKGCGGTEFRPGFAWLSEQGAPPPSGTQAGRGIQAVRIVASWAARIARSLRRRSHSLAGFETVVPPSGSTAVGRPPFSPLSSEKSPAPARRGAPSTHVPLYDHECVRPDACCVRTPIPLRTRACSRATVACSALGTAVPSGPRQRLHPDRPRDAPLHGARRRPRCRPALSARLAATGAGVVGKT